VAETPEQLWKRAHAALRTPPVEEWEQWPFRGPVVPKELEPPSEERRRLGEGGVDCPRCARPDEEYLWASEHWRLTGTAKPAGLPAIVILETRAHHDLPDLPPALAEQLGPLILRVERAVRAVGEIGNVHVCRWGDGSEHFHLWFLARPARMPQLSTSFAAIWDDVLPPLPDEVWRANLDSVASSMRS
jgi:diadenosine tetraphosphate (Ap4A) HIT family hydrolase